MTQRTKPEPRAQIVVTIGPSAWDEEHLGAFIDAGADVVRVNMSWSDHETNGAAIERARKVAEEHGVRIPIVLDLSGPREQEGSEHHFGGGEVITEKDIKDIAFGAEIGVEYIALSYVGSTEDITRLREHLAEAGSSAKVIAKIERKEAVEKAEEIIEAADAVMIARGDLGNEVPLEQIPFIERNLIGAARVAGKPVIVATELMSSMIDNDRPARADVTDVAYAIVSGADAVMLSNETATGEYPVETVQMMDKILLEAEKHREAQDWHLL